MKRTVFFMTLTGLISALCGCIPKNEKLQYPVAEKQDVGDDYFGTIVADPYRWMEDDTTKAVADWVAAENNITDAYLGKILFREQLKQRLTDLTDYEKFGMPFKKHGKYYYYKNDGLQNQSVLYVKETLDGEASVMLDPNKLSEDGTVALSEISFSNDGKYMAYTISRSGSDWREIYVMDIATRQLTSDHICWAKFTDARWRDEGFYYSAYDAPEEGREFSGMNENHKIYYHKLNTDQKADMLVYENKKYPKRFYTAWVDDDETLLFVFESGEGRGNRLFVKDLRRPEASFVQLAEDFDYEYSPVEVTGETVYFYTNYGAPKYRLMKADINAPELKHWTEVVPEDENVLNSVSFIGGKMILTYTKDASDHAYVYSIDGKREYEVTLPTFGSIGFSGDKDDKEAFYLFTSFTFPSTIYKYDIERNRSEKYLAPDVRFNADDFITEQVFYQSKDGTRIPMFITYKKGLQRDGRNPVYLYAYGGFNISLSPAFSTWRIPFLENGGIYAQANLRGGGEYGEAWHIAGTKMQKQNVFDDFIAAAEYLITENYTTNKKICIAGGSNGGLLVGAVVNQRPELFGVALPAVGVMDMLRYHKFTVGWNWASDYGTSEESREMFEYLYGYSPLHTIKNDGTPYPAVFVTTADHDDRVVPAHSFKYTATLQAADTGDAPKLIRIETKAGHGAGKPVGKIIEEYTDVYSFAMYNLSMKPKF
ncbi:MAG: prolyl oligopeptidase family serine peptidase [Tannerella sp.]|jgi:prolyl oligopeptidase|nr:prolyl oligopeptidase family serine peptidase [Tannerella sp.]